MVTYAQCASWSAASSVGTPYQVAEFRESDGFIYGPWSYSHNDTSSHSSCAGANIVRDVKVNNNGSGTANYVIAG